MNKQTWTREWLDKNQLGKRNEISISECVRHEDGALTVQHYRLGSGWGNVEKISQLPAWATDDFLQV